MGNIQGRPPEKVTFEWMEMRDLALKMSRTASHAEWAASVKAVRTERASVTQNEQGFHRVRAGGVGEGGVRNEIRR